MQDYRKTHSIAYPNLFAMHITMSDFLALCHNRQHASDTPHLVSYAVLQDIDDIAGFDPPSVYETTELCVREHMITVRYVINGQVTKAEQAEVYYLVDDAIYAVLYAVHRFDKPLVPAQSDRYPAWYAACVVSCDDFYSELDRIENDKGQDMLVSYAAISDVQTIPDFPVHPDTGVTLSINTCGHVLHGTYRRNDDIVCRQERRLYYLVNERLYLIVFIKPTA